MGDLSYCRELPGSVCDEYKGSPLKLLGYVSFSSSFLPSFPADFTAYATQQLLDVDWL